MPSKKTKPKIKKKSGAPRGNKNALGNEGGAPSKYGPWAIEIAKKYIERCKDSYKQLVQSRNTHEGKNSSNSSESFQNVLDVELPMIAGLAQDLDVDKETVTAWAKLHVEFGRLVRWVRLEQERRLVNGGVSSKYNSGMSRFVLAAQHGYSETIKHKVGELEKDDLDELSNEELERIARGG